MKPRVAVACAVVRRGGEFLIQRRPAGVHLPGLWEFAGGRIEPGETPEDTVRREGREELGVELEPLGTLHVETHEYPERTVTIHFLEARILSGEPAPRHASEVRWVRSGALGDYEFPPANRAVLDQLGR